MATETLTCNHCGEDWTRQVKRGRKPKHCPDCKNGDTKKKKGLSSLCAEDFHHYCNGKTRSDMSFKVIGECGCDCHDEERD